MESSQQLQVLDNVIHILHGKDDYKLFFLRLHY